MMIELQPAKVCGGWPFLIQEPCDWNLLPIATALVLLDPENR